MTLNNGNNGIMQLITFKGVIYTITKEECDEPNSVFINRVWWIVKNIDNPNTKSIKELCNLSYIWSNIYHNGVSYDKNIMLEITQYYNLYDSPIKKDNINLK
jgi:hypothetical protein